MNVRARIAAALALICAVLVTAVSPRAAVASTTAIQVAPGGDTTCVVVTGGNAYCWGANNYGQLGNGTTTASSIPVLVSGGHTWASISARTNENDGTANTCAVTTAGAGYCWGGNIWGEDGDGTQNQHSSPTLVAGGHTWRTIVVGWSDTCGITTANDAYCWGLNFHGEVGDGTSSQRLTPTLVGGSHLWSSISVGFRIACGVTTSDAGYCWGANWNGEVGDGTNGTDRTTPTLVSGGYSWTSLSTGYVDTCGVTTTGVGYCWGYGFEGEGGNGGTADNLSPTLVSGSHTWATITTGQDNTCGLTTGGTAYCWGRNAVGENGDGTNSQDNVPTAVSGGYTFTAIVTGAQFVDDTNCGVTTTSVVYCWGHNNTYQIGDGTTTDRNVPVASWVLESVNNTNLSVTITPTFTFTVGNRASACNGESNFAAGAGSATAVALGSLAAGANVSGGQALTVAGNSGGGFVVYVAGTQASQNLRASGVHNWTDVSGTYASPAPLAGGEQFGYTYKDSTGSSSMTNPSAANFVALTNANEPVMGSNSSATGSGCISYDAQASAATPAASYTATVIYTAVPTF